MRPTIIDLYGRTGLGPSPKGYGGEWAGPCPGCGGDDRFVLWEDQGRAWCRQCGWSGDGI